MMHETVGMHGSGAAVTPPTRLESVDSSLVQNTELIIETANELEALVSRLEGDPPHRADDREDSAVRDAGFLGSIASHVSDQREWIGRLQAATTQLRSLL